MFQLDEGIWQNLNTQNLKRAVPFAGAALIMLGIARRTPLSVLLAAVGGGMVYQGLNNPPPNGNLYEKGMPTQMLLHQGQGIRVEEEVIIKRTPQDLYTFWRNFENLPRVMHYLESVKVVTPTRSHWVAKAPAGQTVSWDADIISEGENEFIGWRSVDGALVPNAGSVHFKPAPSGTASIVKIILKYDPPGGWVGDTVVKLFGTSPSETIAEDLHRFKAIMEN